MLWVDDNFENIVTNNSMVLIVLYEEHRLIRRENVVEDYQLIVDDIVDKFEELRQDQKWMLTWSMMMDKQEQLMI